MVGRRHFLQNNNNTIRNAMNSVITSATLALASALVVNAGASSTGQFRLDKDALHGTCTFQWQDIDALLTIDENADGELTETELQQSNQLLVEFGEMLYSLKQSDVPIDSPRTSVALTAEGGIVFDLTFQLSTAAAASSEELALEFAGASDFPLTHQHAFHVSDAAGTVIVDEVSDRSIERPVFPEPGTMPDAVSATVGYDQGKIPPSSLAGSSPRIEAAPASTQSLTVVWVALSVVAGWCGHFVVSKTRK